MATIPPPTRTRNLSDSHQRVRSPLARLRGYIRAYVALEGALLLVLLLAVWFWVELALDYGSFKLFALDWVQEWPWGVRAVLLVALSIGVLAAVSLNVFGRLFRDFSDASLALVLERRFPKLLGDRLITAVELSDLRKAEEQGYSPAMVLETIHEAAERVQQAPVGKAFDWGRLGRRAGLALGLTLGLYVVVGGLFLTLDALWHVRAGRIGYDRFNEVAQIVFERDALLRNTIWPRRAQVEFVTYTAEDLHVGQGDKVPSLRVRALEYVVADSKTPEGWRALRWNDLENKRGLRGSFDVPEQPFALTPRDPAGLTVDEVALRLRKFDVRTTPAGADGTKWLTADAGAPSGWRPLLWSDLTPEKLDGIPVPTPPADWKPAAADAELTVDDVEKAVASTPDGSEAAKNADVILSRLGRIADVHALLEQVNARAALPDMSRVLRRLDLPDVLYLKCVGDKTYLRNEMRRGQDNEYTGTFDLKESAVGLHRDDGQPLRVSFTVQADDYYTPHRTITLVPPPSLVGLNVAEMRPAYLYYRPNEATTLGFLRGKKQPFQVHDVLQAGSETSRIDVPAGTDLVLTARSDKPLREAFLKAGKNVEEMRIRVAPTKLQGGDATPFGSEASFKIPDAAEPGVAVVRPAKVGEVLRLPLDLTPGANGFVIELPNVRQDLVFDFEFADVDGVKGKRKVVIKPQDDTAPELTDVQVETIRKDAKTSYYLVTRNARIPVTAKVHDDHALAGVQYRYGLRTARKDELDAVFNVGGPAPRPAAVEANLRADVAALLKVPAVALAAPTGGPNPFQAAAYLTAVDQAADRWKQNPATSPLTAAPELPLDQSYAPPRFAQIVRDAQDELPSETVHDLLAQAQLPPFRQLVRDLDLKPDAIEVFPPAPGHAGKNAQDNRLDWDFPLWQMTPQDMSDTQSSYRLDLQLESADTDADEQVAPDGQPQPHRSKSKETFSFLIVPESQLLAKIGEDEVKQYASLNKRFQDLQEKAGLMDTGVTALDRPDVQVKDLLGPSTRAEQINENLENSLTTTREVFGNYQRMVKEEELNVIRMEKIVKTQDTILAPLKQIIDEDFPTVMDANAKFRKALDDKGMSDKDRIDASRTAGKDVSLKMAKLLKDLNDVLDVMKGLGGIAELVDQAMHIRDGVHNIQEAADKLKVVLENQFFDEPAPKK